MKPRTFPVALIVEGKRVVVVGESPEASRRAQVLRDLGADVVHYRRGAGRTEVAPAEDESLDVRAGAPKLDDLRGALFVLLADRDEELAARLHALARTAGTLFAALDQRPHLDFFHLAVARQGVLTVAVGTEGHFPGLAARLKEELLRVLTESRVAAWLELAIRLREALPAGRRRSLLEALREVRLLGRLELPELHSNSGSPGEAEEGRGGR